MTLALRPDLFAPSRTSRVLVSDPKPIPSKEIWVDCNRTDHYTPNGTYQKPFKKIQDAINSASGSPETFNSDVISLVPGHYEEDVIIDRPVTIRGSSQQATTVYSVTAEGTIGTGNYIALENLIFSYLGFVGIDHIYLHRIKTIGLGFQTCTNVYLEGCSLGDDTIILNSEVVMNNCVQQVGLLMLFASHLFDWPPGVTETVGIMQNSRIMNGAGRAANSTDGGATGTVLERYVGSYGDCAIDNTAGCAFENCCSVFVGGFGTVNGTYTNYAGYPLEP